MKTYRVEMQAGTKEWFNRKYHIDIEAPNESAALIDAIKDSAENGVKNWSEDGCDGRAKRTYINFTVFGVVE